MDYGFPICDKKLFPTRVPPETDSGSSSGLLGAKAVTQWWCPPLIPSARHPILAPATPLQPPMAPSPEDSLAYERTPSAPISRKGEKKRTQEVMGTDMNRHKGGPIIMAVD